MRICSFVAFSLRFDQVAIIIAKGHFLVVHQPYLKNSFLSTCRPSSLLTLGLLHVCGHFFKMRVNGAVATALYSSALLLGQVRAEDEDVPEASSVEAVESSTSSAIEKPTFTVCIHLRHCCPSCIKMAIKYQANVIDSPTTSKHRFSNNSQTDGIRGGHHLMPRRKIQRRKKSGRTLENGRLKNQASSRRLRATKVSWSRILQLTMQFRPSSQRRLITRARRLLFSTKSSFKVSSCIFRAVSIRRWLTEGCRRPRMWWSLHEASPRQQEASRGRIFQRFSLHDHVWS